MTPSPLQTGNLPQTMLDLSYVSGSFTGHTTKEGLVWVPLSVSCLSLSVCLSHLCLSLSLPLSLSLSHKHRPPHMYPCTINSWRSALPKIINDLVGSKGNNQLGRGNEPTKAKFRAQAVTKANTNCSNNLTAGSACRVCLHSPPLNTEHLPSRVKDSCAFDYVG